MGPGKYHPGAPSGRGALAPPQARETSRELIAFCEFLSVARGNRNRSHKNAMPGEGPEINASSTQDRWMAPGARPTEIKTSDPMSARTNTVKVSLDAQELLRLDELRGDEERAVFLRRLLYEPPDGSEVATRGEALAILSRLARDGKVAAAIALARELRGDQPAGELEAFLVATDGELERFCGFARRFLTDEQGRPLVVEPFQRQILADYFDGARETIVLLSKKNGKTSLFAGLAIWHTVTTEFADTAILAASRDQAGKLLQQLIGYIKRSAELRERCCASRSGLCIATGRAARSR